MIVSCVLLLSRATGLPAVVAAAPLEIITLNPMEVLEGGSDVLTNEHVRINFGYRDYVDDQDIFIRIYDPPSHGHLEVEVNARSSLFYGKNLCAMRVTLTQPLRYRSE